TLPRLRLQSRQVRHRHTLLVVTTELERCAATTVPPSGTRVHDSTLRRTTITATPTAPRSAANQPSAPTPPPVCASSSPSPGAGTWGSSGSGVSGSGSTGGAGSSVGGGGNTVQSSRSC